MKKFANDMFWDVRKWVVVFAILFGLIACATAHAQTAPADDDQTVSKTGSWVVGTTFAPAGRIKFDLEPIGTAPGGPIDLTQQKRAMLEFYGGYKPVGGFGGEVRFLRFGTKGGASDSVNGALFVFGPDISPRIVSSAGILTGNQNYMAITSMDMSKLDLLGNRTWGLPGGAFTAFGGISFLNVESKTDIGVSQQFLLLARLPNGTIDPTAIGERYTARSNGAVNARKVGLTFGGEGEYCLIGALVLEGRVAIGLFPWGSSKATGQFDYTKEVSLVRTADGVNGTPFQTVAHLNLAPNQGQYSRSVSGRITELDARAVVKWWFHFGKARLDVGAGVFMMDIDGFPSAPGYTVRPGFSAGQGAWAPRASGFSLVTPMVTANIWFGGK